MLITTPVFAFKQSALSSLIQQKPLVYKPTKLIIGQDNKFLIKAAPNTNVIFITSAEATGASTYLGQTLRLGTILNKIDAKTAENGVVEVNLPISNDKTLIGTNIYFEVLILNNNNPEEATLAQVMSPAARESALNVVAIYDKPKNLGMPSLDPLVPGLTDNVNQVINGKPMVPQEDEIKGLEMQYSRFTPAMIRNLNAIDNGNK